MIEIVKEYLNKDNVVDALRHWKMYLVTRQEYELASYIRGLEKNWEVHTVTDVVDELHNYSIMCGREQSFNDMLTEFNGVIRDSKLNKIL